MHPYYRDKLPLLRTVFGSKAALTDSHVVVGEHEYPIVDDVIVTLGTDRLPSGLRDQAVAAGSSPPSRGAYASDIQHTFGEEWKKYPEMLDEYQSEVLRYFDLVDLDGLGVANVVDLGCGTGRWAALISGKCGSITLVDYSEAIFVARQNIGRDANAIFVMADVLDLPFVADAFDFAYCLGVLHHLPTNGLMALRDLRPLARTFLVYVYYALDNRPPHFRAIFAIVNLVRRQLSKVHSPSVREIVTWSLTLLVYKPLCVLGAVASRVGMARLVPLAEWYQHASLRRLRQDVYDRFFTPIEQRFTRSEVMELSDVFQHVKISDEIPYWHFVCER